MKACETSRGEFEFSPEEIQAAVRNGKLLSLELEISLACNFKCPYCYVGKDTRNHLSRDEVFDVVRQARALGAQLIIILGGEPMILPDIMGVIEFISEKELRTQVFTNGSRITPERARRLRELKAGMVVKVNSFDRETQDRLTGVEGSYQIMLDALDNLKSAGYPDKDAFLAASTVICRQNLNELPAIWRKLRDEGISPYFETITPQGAAEENEWLHVSVEEKRDMFHKLAEIDRNEYGISWEPQPPLVANRCLRHQFSCMVNSSGDVVPCVGVPLSVGNIRGASLEEILQNSTTIDDLRHFRERIKGPCRDCEKGDQCYGCRGAAYNLTGDYLASDPTCWLNAECRDAAKHLPAKARDMVPHREPALLVDQIHACGEDWGEVSVRLEDGALLASSGNRVEEAAYLEMIAQAAAALNGFRNRADGGASSEGYLLGTRNLRILGRARPGEDLRVRVRRLARLGDLGVVEGRVMSRGRVVATGEVKVWQSSGEPGEQMPAQGQ